MSLATFAFAANACGGEQDEAGPPDVTPRNLADSVEKEAQAATAILMARTPDSQTDVSVKHTACIRRSTTKWTCRVTSRFDALDDPREGFTGIATYDLTTRSNGCWTGTARTKNPAREVNPLRGCVQ